MMDIEFWEQRWELNQTAFHLSSVNPHLKSNLSKFNLKVNSQIFVPLCGKSVDMVWLKSQKYSIIGVECSEKAVKDFFTENKLQSQVTESTNFSEYKSKNICLLQGDYFKVEKKLLSDIALVYDRASLIALPEPQRKNYVNHLNKILPVSAEIFLITLEYNQVDMSGPPFSVDHKQVTNLYSAHYKIEMLDEIDVLSSHIRFKERGLKYLIERIYRIYK